MTIAINDLYFVHSGGSANVTPANDLGGAISTAGSKRVKSQSATTPNTITGVTIVDAYGNPEGAGTLTFVAASKLLGWKAAGEVSYFGVDVSVSGTYLIGSSSGYLVVAVTAGSLPVSDKVDSLTISNLQQNVFESVTPSVALLGKTSYRCLYIFNSNASNTAVNVKLWRKTPTPAGDEIMIGLGSSIIGGTEQTIANETTAPTSVAFSAPSSYAAALSIGDIPPLSWKAFWQRRVVPPETRGTLVSNSAVLAIAADI